MDIEEFRKEVEARLEGKSKEQQVAFAVRSAMRVLPLLTVQKKLHFFFKKLRGAFWFWQKENKQAHLASLLRAYAACMWCVSALDTFAAHAKVTHSYAAETAAETAAKAADTDVLNAITIAAYAAAAYSASNAFNAAVNATTATTVAYDAYAAATVAYYAYAIANADSTPIVKEIQADLILIDQLTAQVFLQAPLWSSPPPEEWLQWLNNFKTDALSLNAGFEVWLDWYEERLQGKLIDVDLLEQWVNIPEEIESQSVAAINAYLKNLAEKTATQPLNRVRAIFIGYGEAGKTSLIRALHNEPVAENEPMTAGIDIRDWFVPNKP